MSSPTLVRANQVALTLAVCLLWSAFVNCQAQAINRRNGHSRIQRQTITNELSTGLTGTGISFNSYYPDPYQQKSVLNQPIDEYDWGRGRTYGRYPGYGYANGIDNGGSYDTPPISSSYQPVNSYGGSGWAGFGYGKYGRASGRYPAGAYGGIKY